MIAGICTFPRLPCPCTKRQVMPNLTSTGVCNTGTSALYVCNLFLWLPWWWMLLYRTLRKVTSTNMGKHMHVVTPRCAAAAAIVSAVVLRRPTKEYTHPYSMMHRRLPTAGVEVAPHYHQLLVMCCLHEVCCTVIFLHLLFCRCPLLCSSHLVRAMLYCLLNQCVYVRY